MDNNGITISNIVTNAKTYIVGEKLNIRFDFKNQSGVTIPRLYIQAVLIRKDFVGNTSTGFDTIGKIFGISIQNGDTVNLANGASMSVSASITIPDKVAQYFTDYSETRAVPVNIRYVAQDTSLGNFGTTWQTEAFVLNKRFNPQITGLDLERYADGQPSDEGENVLMTLSHSLSTTVNASSMLAMRLHYKKNGDATTSSASIDLSSNIGKTSITTMLGNTFSKGSDWGFLVYLGDKYENVTLEAKLFKSFANLHLSGESVGGVCFGSFCTKTTDEEGNPVAKFECHYPAYFYGGIVLGGMKDYSLDEVDTGVKWIDGSPIYRKVVEVGAVNKGATVDTDMNTGALGAVINMYGIRYNEADGLAGPLPYANTAGASSILLAVVDYKTAPKVRVVAGSGIASTGVVVVVEYTKA